MSVRVESAARLHFGFLNLSLSHDRLYGSLGLALDRPRVVVEADAAREDGDAEGEGGGDAAADDSDVADRVRCEHARARAYAERACEILDVQGVDLTVREELRAHTGLGSGTQLSLAVLTAVARAYDQAPGVREHAPELGRGGRSGAGVATFEGGGFVLDAGHPTGLFTTDAPPRGAWTVPAVTTRHRVPADWRFVLVVPDVAYGKSGDSEDESMRSAVEAADPGLANRISGVVTRRVLPALADGDADAFGAAVAEVGRLNGAWYADEQGGVYRPPVGAIVDALTGSSAVAGAGQSSWGPAVYGVTDAARADAAEAAGREALDATDVDGEVRVVRPRNDGAQVSD